MKGLERETKMEQTWCIQAGHSQPGRRYTLQTVRFLVLALVCCSALRAHQLRCFAAAEGATVSGYAWLGSGARAKRVSFQALAGDGTVLARGETDENGEFSFQASCRCDHMIEIRTPDGHLATFRVTAAELPSALPSRGAQAGALPSGAPRSAAGPTPSHEAADAPGTGGLEATVAEAVSRQITPLRRDVQELTHRRRLQDILGGVGYLLGLAGIAFYFLGSRQRRKS